MRSELEARTLRVRAGMRYVSHPYYDEHGRLRECVTERPDPICVCGSAFLEWEAGAER